MVVKVRVVVVWVEFQHGIRFCFWAPLIDSAVLLLHFSFTISCFSRYLWTSNVPVNTQYEQLMRS